MSLIARNVNKLAVSHSEMAHSFWMLSHGTLLVLLPLMSCKCWCACAQV